MTPASRELFVLTNFDGTTFNTFEPAPSGINVPIAYDRAVQSIFGEAGFTIYQNKLGGLQNREPGELFDLIAKRLEIDVDAEFGSRKEGVRAFVDAKLQQMLPDISPEWPLPYKGVIDFFRAVEDNEIPVTVGIASSGHRGFINRVYEVNGLIPPAIMATSDEINNLVEPRRGLYKPNTYQIAALHFQRLRQHLGNDYFQWVQEEEAKRFLQRDEIKQRMIYVGDHPGKDGGVAGRARIPYGFVPFVHPEYQPTEGQVRFEDFSVLHDLIRNKAKAIEGGMTSTELLLNRTDEEVYPRRPASERPYQSWLANPNRDPREFGVVRGERSA